MSALMQRKTADSRILIALIELIYYENVLFIEK